MTGLRTERIRCILCNKRLDWIMDLDREIFICSECQAYFCSSCLQEIKGSKACPAASLLEAADHELKLLKILLNPLPQESPPEGTPLETTFEKKTVKILPKKSVKIIDDLPGQKKRRKNSD